MSHALAKAAPVESRSNVVQLQTGRDPIFAAIAAFNAAYHRYSIHVSKTNAAEARMGKDGLRQPRAFYGWLHQTSTNTREPLYAHSADRIDQIFDDELEMARNMRWISPRLTLSVNCKRAKAKAELEADAANLKRLKDESGYTAAHEKMIAAMNEMHDAQDALCKTQCTTLEGVQALAALALRRIEDGMWDDYYVQKFVAGLAGKRPFQ